MATGNRSKVNSLPKIDSIPNLRLLCKRSTSSDDTSSLLDTAALYRSARPDGLTRADLDEFRKLGIKCIIDFRSKDEYLATRGHSLLDKEYALCEVILPKENFKPGQSVKYELRSLTDIDNVSSPMRSGQPTQQTPTALADNHDEEDQLEKRHFLINFFSLKYIRTVFNRLPWHLWCLGILYFVWDIIMFNKLKKFKKFFATKAISTCGIFGQYIDIIELSQPAICSALKLISDSENLPALINCAFGKDRTGIMSALILTLLGMPKEYVAEEYSLSTEGLGPIRQQLYKDVTEKHSLSEEFCSSEAATMRNLLTYIEDRYKSVEQYLTSIGFTEQEQKKLKKTLKAFHKSHK